MRRLTILVLATLACACATPAERAAQMQREVDEMMQVYGPGCEKLGYKPDTDPWRDCVLRLATRDSFERYGAYSRAPMMTSCWGSHGFFNCSTF
jgi:hypothetical protein